MNRQNFISADFKTAISSQDDWFTVGEVVEHQDKDAGEATIIGFGLDTDTNEVKVFTSEGYAHLDFLVKIETN